MTLPQFNALSYPEQLAAVYTTGTHLATRWEGMQAAVFLYHLPGKVFAEVCYDAGQNRVTNVRSFEGGEQLENYTMLIQLPEGLDESEDL